MQVVVTAPHAFCRNVVERDCDRVASRAASYLAASLTKRGHMVSVVTAWTPRAKLDLNRRTARRSEFRRDLRELLAVNQVLFDVHSFPADTKWAGVKEDEAPELVLLDNGPSPWCALGKKLQGVHFAFLEGDAKLNDIVLEAREKGLAALLLEFNESLANQRIKQICDLISVSLAQIFPSMAAADLVNV